jgi:two-component system osmolarity sensor histidine kinase EnvZ
LWRSVFLIAALLVVANVASLQIFRASERGPRVQRLAQGIASVVNITRWALITADATRRFELLQELSQTEGIQVYVGDPRERVAPLRRPFLQEIAAELKRQLGPQTEVTDSRNGVRGFWVSFSIDGDRYWVYLPRSRSSSHWAARTSSSRSSTGRFASSRAPRDRWEAARRRSR